jgi:hypothetical protein
VLSWENRESFNGVIPNGLPEFNTDMVNRGKKKRQLDNEPRRDYMISDGTRLKKVMCSVTAFLMFSMPALAANFSEKPLVVSMTQDDMSGHDMNKDDMSGHDMNKDDMSGHDMSKDDMDEHDMSGHDRETHETQTQDTSFSILSVFAGLSVLVIGIAGILKYMGIRKRR